MPKKVKKKCCLYWLNINAVKSVPCDFTTLLCQVLISPLDTVNGNKLLCFQRTSKLLKSCLFLQLLSRILHFLLSFVITIFCGHISNAALAGYALASAVRTVLLFTTFSLNCLSFCILEVMLVCLNVLVCVLFIECNRRDKSTWWNKEQQNS